MSNVSRFPNIVVIEEYVVYVVVYSDDVVVVFLKFEGMVFIVKEAKERSGLCSDVRHQL